ncbi:glycoside hydrolase family protein [Geochorda subterranea]|uniref:glycoside hydrolase n=1 Tax=Geochorda subterranea TaxID=3109564 RepID=UPI00386011B0
MGDVIPFYKDGKFWLFYLHDARTGDEFTVGTSWYLVTTSDFVHYEEHGAVLQHGTPEEQDWHCYTGSIIEAGGLYHLFYTGFNPHPKFRQNGTPLQAVMHAVSRDLVHWDKLPEDTFYAPPDRYERGDWRDPFVFFNPEAQEYWMLLAARTLDGSYRRRGCIALCTSRDLRRWEVKSAFWAPRLYVTHECPDLFKLGDWWYLVYSSFSERFATHYRMSKDLQGPWTAPANDTFDGRAFYAAKTCSDGVRRYVFGWIPTKTGDSDYGEWQWGGTMAVHEIVQRPDGSLGVRMPESLRAYFSHSTRPAFSPECGTWSRVPPTGQSYSRSDAPSHAGLIESDALLADVPDSFALALAEPLVDPCLISGDVIFKEGTRGCGLVLRVGSDPDEAYYIRLEPQSQRMVFDQWPRKAPRGEHQWQIGGDKPFAVELERPVRLEPGKPYRMEVIVDGTACVAYVAGQVAMSTRLYSRRGGDGACS